MFFLEASIVNVVVLEFLSVVHSQGEELMKKCMLQEARGVSRVLKTHETTENDRRPPSPGGSTTKQTEAGKETDCTGSRARVFAETGSRNIDFQHLVWSLQSTISSREKNPENCAGVVSYVSVRACQKAALEQPCLCHCITDKATGMNLLVL